MIKTSTACFVVLCLAVGCDKNTNIKKQAAMHEAKDPDQFYVAQWWGEYERMPLVRPFELGRLRGNVMLWDGKRNRLVDKIDAIAYTNGYIVGRAEVLLPPVSEGGLFRFDCVSHSIERAYLRDGFAQWTDGGQVPTNLLMLPVGKYFDEYQMGRSLPWNELWTNLLSSGHSSEDDVQQREMGGWKMKRDVRP